MPTMYDSVETDLLPADAQMVASYVDGIYADFDAVSARFPGVPNVSITVVGRDAAGNWVKVIVIDCENGDATPHIAAAWAAWMLSIGLRPTIYCNTSTHPTVVSELAVLGLAFVANVDWWEANYDGDPTLTPGSAAKQYQSTTDWDVSSTAPGWPAALFGSPAAAAATATAPAPAPPPSPQAKDDEMYAFVVQPPATIRNLDGSYSTAPVTSENEVVVPLPFLRKGVVSFSCDFAPQQCRVMVGGPSKGWRHAPTSDPTGELGIPVGRSSLCAINFEADDEIVSVVHRGGNDNQNHPVTILVEPA